MKKGKLIVIDGTDGSGKATQVDLLAKRLKKEGHTVKMVDFPEYYNNFFGKLIGQCLSDEEYGFLKLHPKIASVLYAADRFESSHQIRTWIDKGYVVLANRYVSANQIHQGGKIKNAKKREAYLEWLDEMEYTVFKIPRPDIVLYLSLPIDIILRLIDERNKNTERSYLKKKKDVHESDKDFLVNSRSSAMWLATKLKNFIKIDCAEKKSIRTREDIHEEVYRTVGKILKK